VTVPILRIITRPGDAARLPGQWASGTNADPGIQPGMAGHEFDPQPFSPILPEFPVPSANEEPPILPSRKVTRKWLGKIISTPNTNR
jgi:hypothetical protein